MCRWILCLVTCAVLSGCTDAVAPRAIPEAPENLLVVLRTTEIQLNWRDASRNEDSFRVEVSIDDGPWLLLAETPANVGSAKFPAPEPVTNYHFRVAACNAAGCSEFKEVVVNTSVWARPSLRITSVGQISSTAINVALNVDSDFPVKLRMIVRQPGVFGEPSVREEDLGQEQLQNESQIRRYFFYGLQPGRTYVVDATVESRFGMDRADPVQITLIDRQPPSHVDVTVTSVRSTFAIFQARVHPGSAPASAYVVLTSETGAETRSTDLTIQPDMIYRSAAERPRSVFFASSLTPGTRYHWKFVATNQYGSASVVEGALTTLLQ